MVQLCFILMCSVLYSPLLNFLSVFVYKRVNGANPTSLQIRVAFLSSGRRSSPAHRVWPKGWPLWDSSHSRSSQHQLCQRCGHMKSRLLVIHIYLWQQHHQQAANKSCIFGALVVSLSANLSDHDRFSACIINKAIKQTLWASKLSESWFVQTVLFFCICNYHVWPPGTRWPPLPQSRWMPRQLWCHSVWAGHCLRKKDRRHTI